MKKHGFFSGEMLVSLFGINAALDMFSFSVKLQLAALPPELKFWLFWAGAALLALGVTWATYVFFGHKKVKWQYVAGVAVIGIVSMIFASPLLPYFFPVDPVALSTGGDSLEAGGWSDLSVLIAPVFIALILYGLVWIERKK